MVKKWWRWWIAVVALFLAACGGGGGGTPFGGPGLEGEASITLSVTPEEVLVNESAAVTASVKDAYGQPADVEVTFEVLAPDAVEPETTKASTVSGEATLEWNPQQVGTYQIAASATVGAETIRSPLLEVGVYLTP